MKMQNLGKLIIVITLSIGLVNAASVTASVDTVEVVKGNPVSLRIKAVGGSAAFPKILMVDTASVSGTSTSSSSNWSLVNGSMHSEVSTTKTIQFLPEKDMTVPSYSVNISGQVYKTKPIEIKVVKSTAPSNTSKNSLFSLEMRANKKKVRVGESFMLTVYFSLRADVRLSQEVKYTQPDLSEFLVTNTDEKTAYRKGNYQLQEVQYIVTAQNEGNFTITPAQAKVGVPDRSRRDIFGMSFGTKWYQTASNELNIEVLPQAQESDVIGDFKVETHIDAKEVKPNKPVNFTVKIEGKGNLESFDFPKYEIDGVTIYSDEAKIDTKVVDGELYSIYSKSFAFISELSFAIPERTFSMYNTSKKSLEALAVKGFDVAITPVAGTENSISKGVVQTQAPHAIQMKEVIVEKTVEVKSVSWWMIALSFVLGMISMYLLRFIPKRTQKPYKESEALKILYGHMGEDEKIEEMVRKLYAKKNGDKSVQIDKKELRKMVEQFQM